MTRLVAVLLAALLGGCVFDLAYAWEPGAPPMRVEVQAPVDAGLVLGACDAWWEVGLSCERVDREADLVVRVGPVSRGHLAETFTPSALQRVYEPSTLTISPDWVGQDPAQVLSTLVHEVGHAIGAGHLPGEADVMSPIFTGVVEPTCLDLGAVLSRWGDSARTIERCADADL